MTGRSSSTRAAATAALVAAMACIASAPAPAQEFPARPLRLVVGFVPGGVPT